MEQSSFFITIPPTKSFDIPRINPSKDTWNRFHIESKHIRDIHELNTNAKRDCFFGPSLCGERLILNTRRCFSNGTSMVSRFVTVDMACASSLRSTRASSVTESVISWWGERNLGLLDEKNHHKRKEQLSKFQSFVNDIKFRLL